MKGPKMAKKVRMQRKTRPTTAPLLWKNFFRTSFQKDWEAKLVSSSLSAPYSFRTKSPGTGS